MKNISILGSTGSIGTSTLKVIDSLPDEFNVVGLSANKNVELLIEQCKIYRPEVAAVGDKSLYSDLKKALPASVKLYCGEEGLCEVAAHADTDLTVASIVGSAGLNPTVEAIKRGIDIGLANKEVLVMAGQMVTDLAHKNNVKLLPVDSEHNALFQCLTGQRQDWVRRLILTASGGPFLNTPQHELENVNIDDALAHPRWSMGKKISVDSATMMNKGLEVIEAHWLFSVPLENIDVIIHPESIIHSMVEFVDGSYIAQLNIPDMTIPIQYVLTYPERKDSGLFQPIDFAKLSALHFKKPDFAKFPCLSLAYQAAETGHTMPAVLNAANEQAVSLFLKEKIKFTDIPSIIKDVMNQHIIAQHPDIQKLKEADTWARQAVLDIFEKNSCN